MNNLFEEIINLVFEFCDQQTSFQFSLSNKYIYHSSLKKGFARYISYNAHVPRCTYETFLKRFHRHQNSLQTCIMENLNNASLWLPKWVEKVYFMNCKIDQEINPSQVTSTEILYISSQCYESEIKINWDKFPKLREITVIGYQIDFEIAKKKCKFLKKMFRRSLLT